MEEEKLYDYASFGQRLGATLIDGLIIGFVTGIVAAFIFRSIVSNEYAFLEVDEEVLAMTIVGLTFEVLVITFVGSWLYYAIQESSSKMATLGKRVVGLVVTDLEGNRISFARASGRFFGKCLSSSILYIGYIMAAFTEKKQTLHDILSNCLVMQDR